jgi:hypothetical protein
MTAPALEERSMADPHATAEDPNAAPMHHEIQARFAAWQVTLAVVLGASAIVTGLVLGIVLANN